MACWKFSGAFSASASASLTGSSMILHWHRLSRPPVSGRTADITSIASILKDAERKGDGADDDGVDEKYERVTKREGWARLMGKKAGWYAISGVAI